MAKDPAFLFYPGDWLMGTLGMTLEEKGCYLELLVMQFNKGKFTISQAKRTLNGCFDVVWPTLKDKFVCEDGLYYNVRLQQEKEKRLKYTESRRASRTKADEDSVKIYLILDNDTGYYKIGSSVNPLRRFAEMTNQKNPAITVGSRNYKLIWFSSIVKREIEKEVHLKFKSKRITGEWFSLTEEDIYYITSTYGGQTYEERTENEDENINKVVLSEIGSETVKIIANEVWKDQIWKEQICMGLSLKMDELQRWLAMFNSSIANEKIPDFDKGAYKKMSRGWIVKQKAKGVTVESNGIDKKSDSAPLTHLKPN